MQIKATRRYHYTPPEWLKLKRIAIPEVGYRRNTGDSNTLMLGLCIDTLNRYCLAESQTAHIGSNDTMVVFLGEYLSEMYKYMYKKHIQ